MSLIYPISSQLFYILGVLKMSFTSKLKMSQCYYCGEVMKDENLKKHCKLKHNVAKCEASVSGFFASSAKKSKTTAVTSDSTSTELLLTSG